MNLKKLTVLTAVVLMTLLNTTVVRADQYGETDEGKDISIDKQVRHPDNEEWKENLFSSDYKFNPEQDVFFRVKVKNTGDRDLTDVKMKDILPDYLSHVSGDLENTFELKKGEEKVFYITARAYKREDLPNDNGVYCVVNSAEAWFNGDKDKDTAEVCIKKEGEVLGEVTALPEAGPEHTVALISGSLIFALIGMVLLKKVK